MMNESDDFITVTEHETYFMATFHDIEDLDLINIRYVSDAFKKYNSNYEKDWVLDVSGIRFIDSSGIGFLVKQGNILFQKSKTLSLILAQSSVMRLFKANGFDKFLTLYTDRYIY